MTDQSSAEASEQVVEFSPPVGGTPEASSSASSATSRCETGQPASALVCLARIAQRHGLEIAASRLLDDSVRQERDLSVRQVMERAASCGLKGSLAKLDWDRLLRSEKKLPVIVRLKNRRYMVLQRVHSLLDEEQGPPRVILQDPLVGEDAPLIIDRARFERIWTGEVLCFERNYGFRDEGQPFGIGLLKALILREHRTVYDVLTCGLVLAVLALGPFIFWRLMIMKVLYYKSFGTFYALCLGMAVLIAFETMFFFLRRFFAIRLAQRVEVGLNTYVFKRLLRLPMELFERMPTAMIAHRVLQLHSLRSFLEAQLFGTALDLMVLLVFVPVMFFFSPTASLFAVGICLIIAIWVLCNLPRFRMKSEVVHHAEGVRGQLLVQSIRGIRTVKSLVLEARQRHRWDTYCEWVQKARTDLQRHADLVMSVIKPLNQLAVSGPLAIAAYLAMSGTDADFHRYTLHFRDYYTAHGPASDLVSRVDRAMGGDALPPRGDCRSDQSAGRGWSYGTWQSSAIARPHSFFRRYVPIFGNPVAGPGERIL